MGKRSNFERNPRDFYRTPASAARPLIAELHRQDVDTFCEPCAGDGTLIHHLHEFYCIEAHDIEPQAPGIDQKDALTITSTEADVIITNPPWSRFVLHPLLEHFVNIAPTWLLLDAGWMFTRQASPYLRWCKKIIAVGRVKWIPDSPYTSKDDCAWYLFDKNKTGDTIFIGR